MSTADTNPRTVPAATKVWHRALCYAGVTVAGPVLAAVIAPAAAAVVAPLAFALPFITMSIIEAEVGGAAGQAGHA